MSPPGPASPVSLPPALEAVRDDLARLEEALRDDAGVEFLVLRQLLDWVFSIGGKRMRPALVFAAARAGEADPRAVLSLAAAVETLHAATLVHDDLVDHSLVRRGMPTLNTRWSGSATVLAGDWLFSRAAAFAAGTGDVRVMEIFARGLGILTDGELRQLFGREGIPTLAEYEHRIYAKTASLFEASTEAAGILALTDPDQVQALATYGRELGLAFQIVDDILDFTGDAARLGKPVGSDLRTGTVTLPALLHLEAYPEAAAWLGPEADGHRQVDRLVAAVQADAAALEGSWQAARQRLERAVAALEGLPAGEARDDLDRLARYAVERDH